MLGEDERLLTRSRLLQALSQQRQQRRRSKERLPRLRGVEGGEGGRVPYDVAEVNPARPPIRTVLPVMTLGMMDSNLLGYLVTDRALLSQSLAERHYGEHLVLEAQLDDRVRRRILKRQKKRQDIERQDGREAQRRRRVKERIEDDLKAHVDTFREEVREGSQGEGVRLRVYSSGVVQEVEEL